MRDDNNSETAATRLLSGKIAIVVTHVRGLGPSHHLEAFLAKRCRKVLAIYHPLYYESASKSQYRLFENGVLVATGEHSLRGPETLIRFEEVALTVAWVRRFARQSDYFFGVDALNCISGILLRVTRSTRKVVFYVIDWSPKRFDNRILNGIYHLSDRAAALLASETWNVSPVIDKGRWHGPFWSRVGKIAKDRTKIVAIGVAQVDDELTDRIRLPFRLVFLGHLLEKQGLQLAIQALPEIAQTFDDADLLVIGDGPYQAALEDLAQSNGTASRITFLGYVADEDEVLRLLASAAVGLAPYLESEDSFTRFADPGKLKNYLAAGLPIVMTRVPYNAEFLEESGCAVLVKGTADDVASAVVRLFSEDSSERGIRRVNALNQMKGLDWVSVFSSAFESHR
jgi:glycosyltransferase involved in cell wall biosynthesis